MSKVNRLKENKQKQIVIDDIDIKQNTRSVSEFFESMGNIEMNKNVLATMIVSDFRKKGIYDGIMKELGIKKDGVESMTVEEKDKVINYVRIV